MTASSISVVRTKNAGQYLQQLCRHWGHSLAVEFTASAGIVIFPREARGVNWPGHATLKLQAEASHLECRLTASAKEQLESLKGVVAGHLGRFAFREGPLHLDWLDLDAR